MHSAREASAVAVTHRCKSRPRPRYSSQSVETRWAKNLFLHGHRTQLAVAALADMTMATCPTLPMRVHALDEDKSENDIFKGSGCKKTKHDLRTVKVKFHFQN